MKKKRLKPGTFIIMRGLPGSGKSTLIKALHKRYSFVSLEPECVDRGSVEFRGFCKGMRMKGLLEKTQLYRFMLYKTVGLLEKGRVVIWAQPWSQISGILLTVDNIRSLYNGKFSLLVGLVELRIDRSVARCRVASRYADSKCGLSADEFDEKFPSLRYEEIWTEDTSAEPPYDFMYEPLILDGSKCVENNIEILSAVLNKVACLYKHTDCGIPLDSKRKER